MRGDTVYLDNASGSQLPTGVLDAFLDAATRLQVNKGGRYPASVEVTEAKERVRQRTARFVGAGEDAEGVAFGANATTLLFLFAQAVGEALDVGDRIVVTTLDHHANRDPWLRLKRMGIDVVEWHPTGDEATLHLGDLEALLTPRTRVVAMTAASNLLGTYGPVEEVGRLLGERGVRLVVDAVHYAPHRLPDARRWRADAVAFSPYKVFSPHLGALWISRPWREELPDWGLSFLPAGPLRWEPGTQNHEAIVAFGAALDHLAWMGDGATERGTPRDERALWQVAYAAGERHEAALLDLMTSGLDRLGCVRFGRRGTDGRTATVGFEVPGVPANDVAEFLGRRGIAVASGHAYAERLATSVLDRPSGIVRASLAHYSDASDVEALLGGLEDLVRA